MIGPISRRLRISQDRAGFDRLDAWLAWVVLGHIDGQIEGELLVLGGSRRSDRRG